MTMMSSLTIILFFSSTMALNIIPAHRVSILGGRAVFSCYPSLSDGPIVRIEWSFNTSDSSVTVNSTFSEATSTGTLKLQNLSMNFAATRIQCTAEYTSMKVLSSVAVLVIQGHLDPVDSLSVTEQNGIFSLAWLPPFTWDIPSEDPDIRGYCVDVFNSVLIYSKCGINTTQLQYLTPADSVCHNYTFTVTPVNAVGNGINNTVSYFGAEISPEVDEFYLLSRGEYKIEMTASVCTCMLILNNFTFKINHYVNDTIITFNTEQLPVNRHYNVVVDASNAAGSTLSPPFPISTHDILNATATGNADEFTVFTTYFKHSNAKGALFNFAILNDKGDLSFFLLPLNRSDSIKYNIPNLLFESVVRISVYDIESDGVLFNDGDVHVSYPADTMEETGTELSMTTTMSEKEGISCSTTTSASIKIICTNSNTLISGIQFIAQSSDLKETEKLYVSKRFGIDTMVEITLPVGVSGTYQVTGFSIGEMIDSVVYTNRVTIRSLATGTLATMETIMCCVLIEVLSVFI